MVTYTYAVLNEAMCGELADLVSIHYDLECVCAFCDESLALDASTAGPHAGMVYTTAIAKR